MNNAANNKFNFKLSPHDIEERTEEIISERKRILDEIAQLKDNERTFENTFRKYSYDTELKWERSSISFLRDVSTDKEVRAASSNARAKLNEFEVECGMRIDVYESLLAFSKTVRLDDFSSQDRRVITKTLTYFERNGLNLPKDEYEKLKSIKQEIERLNVEFKHNISEDTTKLEFTREELNGLSENFIDHLKKTEEGKYIVTLQYPDLFPVLKFASNPQTRKAMTIANTSRCQSINIPILEKLLLLRREAAKILGYKDHATYVLEQRMAKTTENVSKFLNELKEKLDPIATEELKEFHKLKEEDCKLHNLPNDGIIHSYDVSYLTRLNFEKNYQIEEELIKEYFPIEIVTKGMLEVYEQILSLKFIKNEENANVWHSDVQMFLVYDKYTNYFIGQFYLDLFPREGKFSHACVVPLIGRSQKPDQSYSHPIAAMLTNFPKPTLELPSLLPFNNVKTFFHEFGHIMHHICSQTKYPQFSGTSVERDFVEAPSQMLENWIYEKEVLAKLSGHYKNTSQSLPDYLIEKLIAAKNANTGILHLRQIFFATFDQIVHTIDSDQIDTQSIYHRTRKMITGFEEIEGTNGAASFGHMVGYDSQYYGYLYSQVFSADMFLEFKKFGVLSPLVGKRYRDIILSRGGEMESMDSLIEFLGREPSLYSFLVSIGCN